MQTIDRRCRPTIITYGGTRPLRTSTHSFDAVRALLLKSLHKPLQRPRPNLFLPHLVLDAVLEVGVVVDLHHDEAVGGLLHVDAVEAVADRARRAQPRCRSVPAAPGRGRRCESRPRAMSRRRDT